MHLRVVAKRAALLFALGAVVFLVPEIWGKPWSIRHFYMRALVEQVWLSPQLCTALPLLDWRNDRLDDASPAATARQRALVAKQQERLHSYDRASMSADDQT